MAVDQQDKYLNEAKKANQDIYIDFKLKKYRASTQIPLAVTICQVSRQLIENKNDLLKLIKPKWPPQLTFQSHMKTDKTNRLTDPEFRGNLKKLFFKLSR